MRLLLVAAGYVLLTATAVPAQVAAQDDEATERTIRALEQAEVDALLRGDLDGVAHNWAEDYTVNNPRNEVGRAADGPIRAGTRTYASFIREVERVLIHGETVIVMGNETVVPSGRSPDAGQTIHRRFTNVWIMRDGRWQLVARHANVVCED